MHSTASSLAYNKIEPLNDLSLTGNQLCLSVLNGSSISIAQLREIVKTFDKKFFENPDAPGRSEREAELYTEAEYQDAQLTFITFFHCKINIFLFSKVKIFSFFSII